MDLGLPGGLVLDLRKQIRPRKKRNEADAPFTSPGFPGQVDGAVVVDQHQGVGCTRDIQDGLEEFLWLTFEMEIAAHGSHQLHAPGGTQAMSVGLGADNPSLIEFSDDILRGAMTIVGNNELDAG